MSDIIFTSKINFWIALVLWGSSLLTISVPFWQWKRGKNGSLAQSILLSVVFLPFIALMLIPLFGTKYTLTDSQLQVDSGFSTEHIELKDISYITPTRNALSAPALSLDRIEIRYKDEVVLISPKDKSRFYQEIKARNPNMVIDKESD
ncbi:PH domain-containing protein [uncultured Psychrobacter sp.]|uniref:PH domain-containing protein n=1 Tax=uncultured Psychrobacter sp. TaxID=259303 RepID=UPI003459C66A